MGRQLYSFQIDISLECCITKLFNRFRYNNFLNFVTIIYRIDRCIGVSLISNIICYNRRYVSYFLRIPPNKAITSHHSIANDLPFVTLCPKSISGNANCKNQEERDNTSSKRKIFHTFQTATGLSSLTSDWFSNKKRESRTCCSLHG